MGRVPSPWLVLAAAPLVLFSCLSFPAAQAQTVGIVCFGVGGQSYVNNTRCPGSNACCGVRATCLSNRLCHNPGDGPNVFVRGPCAQRPFDDTCAQICLYNETETGGGVLPRVTPCEDGSLCCNNDPQCCQNRRGVFLDENGNRAQTRATAATTSYPPVGTGTERFTQTPSFSTTATPASTPTEDASNVPGSAISTGADSANSGDGENTSLKIGLGLAIPLAVLLSAAAVYFWLRKKNKSKAAAATETHELPPNMAASEPYSAHTFGTSRSSFSKSLPLYSGPPPPPPMPKELGQSNVAELPAQRRYELG